LQRVCIARAIATNPKLVVLDEPTSSLDLSVRAGILDLLAELRAETKVAMLFISHDLGTVRLISDRIVVLYLGSIVEYAGAQEVFERPAHPYTQALISAHLPPDPQVQVARHVLEGEIPSPIDLPPGCLFSTRCPVAQDRCRREVPDMLTVGEATHQASCLRIPEGGNRILK
jgi:oligopeptide/dipeptide ABC transporter ATP-binding protein